MLMDKPTDGPADMDPGHSLTLVCELAETSFVEARQRRRTARLKERGGLSVPG